MAELINSPNIYSVIVAVLAGLVGVVSLTESRANALIGVFISVTTIPAAASIGLSLAFANWHDARGSVRQLLLNVVLLIAVGAAGLSTAAVHLEPDGPVLARGDDPPAPLIAGWRRPLPRPGSPPRVTGSRSG